MGQTMEGFYTAKEAREILGVTEDKFQYMVRTNQVKKVIPPGRKYGMYLEAEVDELAASINGFVKQYSEVKDKTVFRPARPEDAQEMHDLGENIMKRSGGYGIPTEILMPFLCIPNSEIGHVLVRDDGIIGYFTLLPLKHESMMRLMHREAKISKKDITPDDTVPFEPGEPIECFVWEIMSNPDEKHVGQLLIGKLLTFLHSLGKRGVDISSIYTIATSREGINLARRMGMEVMNLPDLVQPNWIPFEWKIQEHKNWLTKNYIQALRSYKLRQERLRLEG